MYVYILLVNVSSLFFRALCASKKVLGDDTSARVLTMYTKHNILLPILYCLTCQLINTNIIKSPNKFMILNVI